MHPRIFLDNFWRNDIRNEIFVAMSFDSRYDARWEQIFRPAIESITFKDSNLKGVRVDIRKSGDSIISDIIDGIAHAQLVLADISVVSIFPTDGSAAVFRNSNVMFEVGLALACRQPVEVVLVRDDQEKILFDVSHISVKQFDPSAISDSTQLIRSLLLDRLRERELLMDLRLRKTLESLSQFEISTIIANSHHERLTWGGDSLPSAVAMAMPDLLQKQVVRLSHVRTRTTPDIYVWTQFGRVIADKLRDANGKDS